MNAKFGVMCVWLCGSMMAQDAFAQATYFDGSAEGVQSFQQDEDSWRRQKPKKSA